MKLLQKIILVKDHEFPFPLINNMIYLHKICSPDFKENHLQNQYFSDLQIFISHFSLNNFLENINKKVWFWGNNPSVFTLSGQRQDSKNYFFKSTLHMP